MGEGRPGARWPDGRRGAGAARSRSHVPPETPARATTRRSLTPTASGAGLMGHPGGPLVVPVLPRPDLGEASVMLLRKLSQSWSSNSSSGMARVRREPHVRSASSGETRSPYTSRLAVADNQRRAGVQARAATAAAAIEMSSNRRLSSGRRQRDDDSGVDPDDQCGEAGDRDRRGEQPVDGPPRAGGRRRPAPAGSVRWRQRPRPRVGSSSVSSARRPERARPRQRRPAPNRPTAYAGDRTRLHGGTGCSHRSDRRTARRATTARAASGGSHPARRAA